MEEKHPSPNPSPYTERGFRWHKVAMDRKQWKTGKGLWEKLKPFAREMRHAQTKAESLLWDRLRNKQLANQNFRRQHPIGRFIVDFYCPGRKLVIELDGGIHKATRVEDRERQIHLEAFGNKVVRFRNDEVENSIESVLDAITRTMDQISNNSSE